MFSFFVFNFIFYFYFFIIILVCLFCKSGCSGSDVASSLAFHPPEPLYEIKQNKHTGDYIIDLYPEISHQIEYPGLQVHCIETKSKSKIILLFFPVEGAHYTIIFSHGNATDCGAMYSHYALLATTLKVNVIGYDYTGYGPLGGIPTERQVYLDIDAVYNWCSINVTSDPGSRVILYGQSVGSGPSCYLASRQPVAGLILHSPILSGVRVLTTSRLLACCDIFPNIERIKKVRCPVFVIHGLNDNEVGFHHGETLHNLVDSRCRFDPWWVPGRGHNDVLHGNEREYLRRLQLFIDHLRTHMPISSSRSVLESTGSYIMVLVKPISGGGGGSVGAISTSTRESGSIAT